MTVTPWDRLCSLPHLRRAWEAVHRSRGAPGLDRVTVDAFQADGARRLGRLQADLVTGRWRPLPLRRARLPCRDRDPRPLAISTVGDRIVQRAVADLLQPLYEPWFCDVSNAFRPRRSAHRAIREVLGWIQRGEIAWVLRADIRRFFESIDRGHLDALLRARLDDEKVLDLIDRILRQPIRERRQLVEPLEGIPQGSPLSPLLSNIYLDPVDAELSAQHPLMTRFCDDILIGARTEDEAKAALERLEPALNAIGLRLHPGKTGVLPTDEGFEFLGFQVTADGLGPSRGALEALSHRLAEIAAVGQDSRARAGNTFDRWNAYYGTTVEVVAPRLASGIRSLLDADRSDDTTQAAADPLPADPVLVQAEALAQRLLVGFPGREGVFASEGLDEHSQRAFRSVRRGVEIDDIRRHLAGEVCLGVHLLRGNDTVHLAVIDVDAKRRKDEGKGRGEIHPEDVSRARGHGVRLAKQLRARGIPVLLEDSGAKGAHLWMRFASPRPAEVVVRWMEKTLEVCEDPPEHVRVELFPDRDRVPRDGDGPLVKLPLGIHAGSGRRCVLLDPSGVPVRDACAVLDAWEEVPDVCLDGADIPTGADGLGPLDGDRFPIAAELLRRCGVVAAFDRKAAETGHLDHRERLALLGTIGHLDGDEGAAALHAIIANCTNYKERVTQRYLDGNAPHPISCGRLRQQHRELSRAVGCDCRLKVPRGAYPTPLLHVLAPRRVPGFRKRLQEAAGTGKGLLKTATTAGRPPAGAAGMDPTMEVDRLVKQIARHKRNQEGIQASLDRAYGRLEEIFEELGVARVPVEAGVLMRADEDGRTVWRVEV